MSWSNPTQQEAQEAYDAARQKYDSAAEEYLLLTRQRDQYDSQASSVYKNYAGDDQRLTGLRRLEYRLQRVCRFFGSSGCTFDEYVTLFRVNRVELMNALQQFVYCDGMKPITFGPSSSSPEAAYDPDCIRAKQLLEAELARVRELMNELKQQTAASAEAYNELVRKVKDCDSEIKDLKKTMDSCAFDMDHYKKYI